MLEFCTEYIAAGGNRHPSAADWNPSTDLLAFGSDRNVALWEPLGSPNTFGIRRLLKGHTDLVTAVKFFPVASHLHQVIVSGSVDKSVRLWKLSKARVENVAVLEGHASTVICLAVCPNTDILVTGGADATIKTWRVDWAKDPVQVLNLQTVQLEPRFFPLTLALYHLPEADDLMLAVAGTKNIVQVYVGGNGHDFLHQATLVGHEGWVRGVAISKQANPNGDGLLLASASQDKYIRLWRIALNESKQENELSIKAYEESLSNKRHELRGSKNRYLLTFEALLLGHEDWIYTVSWYLADDHLRLLSASADNSVAIWEPDRDSGIWLPTTRLGEISAQKGSTTATGSTGGFWIGLWSRTGQSIVSLGRTGSWRIWNFNFQQHRWVQGIGVSGHTKSISDVAWAKSGAYILSVSADQTARLHAPWTTGLLRPSWHEMARPQIHGYDLSCIDSLAQSYFVSGADEKLLRVFEESWGTAQLLGRLCGISAPVGRTLPLTASIPALSLSNKAIDTGDLDGVAIEGCGPEQLAPRPSSNDSDGIAQSPPTEDDLARRTLWPEQEKLYGHGFEISSIAVSHNGSIVATACKASSLEHAAIRLYSTDDWREVKPPLRAHSLTVTGLAFSKDDRYLLSVGRDRQWALFTSSIDGIPSYCLAHANPKGHARMILDACWAPREAGYAFATAGRDKVVKIWCLSLQGAENVTTLAIPSSATSVDIAPRLVDDELLLAVGTESGEVGLYAIDTMSWDAHVRNESNDLSWPSRAITRVKWRPQRATGSLELAVASEDSSLRLFSISGNIA